MKFSLITVTMGNRPEMLQRLCDSLTKQTHNDYEHIIVDHRQHPEFKGSLSCARNYGLSLAKGDIVAFPDDDAWYAPNILADVADVLKDKSIDGVSFRVTDDRGVCSAGWMSKTKEWISKSSVWHTAVSISFFLKKEALGNIRFNEQLGCGSGTRFGSGEETDFILSVLENGARIVYDGTKSVFHPLTSGGGGVCKGWLYGNGMGAVLRRHHYSPIRLLWAISVQLVRSVQAMLRLNFKKALFHAAMAAGRLCGYLFPPQ